MFSPHTPMRLIGCNGKQIRERKDRRRALVLTFQLQPFSPAMAEDLNVRGRLFSVTSGEPLSDVLGTKLAIAVAPQRVEIRMAPDQPAASVDLPAVIVQPVLNVRKDKEGPVYSATLSMLCDYPAGDHLLLLMQRVTEQFFVTLTAEQGDMLANMGREAPRLVDDDDGEE